MASENLGANRSTNQDAKRRKVNGSQGHTLHTIASYNMSFASDLGATIGSEKHFISDSRKRAMVLGLDHTDRSSWERAARLVRHFWENDAEGHHPSAIGLQEMNTSAIVKERNPQFAGGDERLKVVLDGLNLEFYSANVPGNGGSPTLVTVWDGTKLGKHTYAYFADLGLEPSFLVENENPAKLNSHKGRPITIVCTEGGFTLINLHGPNISAQSYTHHMAKLREAINEHVRLFIARDGVQINPHKLFVMGDFNDPFNAINRNEPLIVHGIPVHYNTEADGLKRVRSCCYNFNELSVGPRGYLKNYRFTGDYAMGVNVVASLQSYRAAYQPVGFRTDVSMESDHEMVIATFASPIAGGRRMRRTRHKALRTHHKQKARRNRRTRRN